MAGIDKTYYYSLKQYLDYREFWIDTYNQQLNELNKAIWLYPFHVYFEIGIEEYTPDIIKTKLDIKFVEEITNNGKCYLTNGSLLYISSESFDKWSAVNCPLDFIQDRLKEQYSENWRGFKLKRKYLKQ